VRRKRSLVTAVRLGLPPAADGGPGCSGSATTWCAARSSSPGRPRRRPAMFRDELRGHRERDRPLRGEDDRLARLLQAPTGACPGGPATSSIEEMPFWTCSTPQLRDRGPCPRRPAGPRRRTSCPAGRRCPAGRSWRCRTGSISSGFRGLAGTSGPGTPARPNLMPDADGPCWVAPMSGTIPSSVGITSSCMRTWFITR